MTVGEQLLTLSGLHVEIGERTIVSGLDLAVAAGRITALVGESGSGKSISAMSTIGLQPPGARVTGSARLDGEELVGRPAGDLRRLRAHRIGTVFQEPGRSLSPVMRVSTVFRDVLAVREDLRGRARVRERSRELLSAVGLPDPDRTAASSPHELSGGELQRVIIALALAGDPQLLIADEPTTALDVTVQRGILALLRRLVAERDMGVLLITHDMGVVGEIADTVVVLKDGEVREAGPVRQVLTAPRDAYTRELLTAVPRLADSVAARAQSVPPQLPVGTPPAVRVEGLSVEYRRRGASHRALTDASVEIAPGQIHGLVGESGSGKSTWGKAIAGLVPVTAGTVELNGVDPSTLGRAERRRAYARLGMVFQDPASSLNPRRTVGWSIAEPLHLAGHADRGEVDRRVRESLERVQLPGSSASRLPHELSGGQRQRVSIARALIHRPSLLIADEPTSALDVTIQAHVIDVLREAIAGAELACLFISHDLAVVGSLADHVTVLRQGRVVEQGPTARVLGDPQQEYTRHLLASVPDPERRLREGDPAPA